MARNQIILDSDDDQIVVTRETSQSGAATPSSAATSSSRHDLKRQSSASTPQPTLSTASKGKKRAEIVLSDSDSEFDSIATTSVSIQKTVKSESTTKFISDDLTQSARKVVSTKIIKKSSTQSDLLASKSAIPSVVRKKSASASKESSVAPSTTSKSATASNSKGKGKGKAIRIVESDAGSDAENGKDELADDSDVEMTVATTKTQDESDQLDSDDDEDIAVDPAKPVKVKAKTRKGATITAAMKGDWKKKTKFEKSQIQLNANHPELVNCWETLAAIPTFIPVQAVQPAGFSLKLLPFQREGLDWMMKQEAGPWHGGMLADEMGMGKTAQTIALILSDYKIGVKQPTLVLAPTVAIIQWKTEIEKFTTGFKILVWHGSNRIESVSEMSKYDVVLTSYAVMESSFRREIKGFMKKGVLMKEDSIIHKLNWHRIILDEAHNIKDRSSNQAKAAFALKGDRRWCLSGTPLQNRVGELYSLIRFIGVDPFAFYFCKQCDCKSLHWLSVQGPCKECKHSGMQHVCYWNNEILKPIQYGGTSTGEGAKAFKKLTTLLERMMLRRTKVERADDMGLPPRVVNVRRDYFNEEEEELYKSLYQNVNRKFSTYADEGTVLNNYSNIFTLITRLRQMMSHLVLRSPCRILTFVVPYADHPDLILKSKTQMTVEHSAADAPTEILVCRVCLDEAEDAISSSCKHIFCRACVRQYLESAVEGQPHCPACHVHMTIDLFQDAIEQEEDQPKQGFLSRIDPSKYKTSTKIEALVEELSKLRTEDSTLKSLVFSQFTTMLDLVERRLQIGGYKTVRLSGTMSPITRHNIITKFTNDSTVTVFLISLKAGGVALNLTEASRVFLMDPWWNPAVELQAMDRIHRIGQYRPVVVTRLIIENSIESRILELQRKKEAMTSSTLGDDDSGLGRLTPEDLQFLFSL